MLLALAFYGALAALAVWATWSDDMWLLGAALMLGFIVSNVVWFAAPVSWRPGPYSSIEVLIAAAAFGALDKAGGCTRRFAGLVMILGVNIVSICANVALVFNTPPNMRQVWLHEVTTNVCFAVECLLAVGVGVAHGYRTGRFHWRPHLRRQAAATLAQPKDGAA